MVEILVIIWMTAAAVITFIGCAAIQDWSIFAMFCMYIASLIVVLVLPAIAIKAYFEAKRQ